jgi:hypothetical protein
MRDYQGGITFRRAQDAEHPVFTMLPIDLFAIPELSHDRMLKCTRMPPSQLTPTPNFLCDLLSLKQSRRVATRALILLAFILHILRNKAVDGCGK